MSEIHRPHPEEPGFVEVWSRAWSGQVDSPLRLRDGSLVDVAARPFSVDGVAVCRYGADGRLTRHRDYWDVATLLTQTGVPIGAS